MVVGIGGGVIGDLAGFVASTFMRGVPIIHIPTSLLAMVDSSIGGKTGVDTFHGKNLIGTFWQPKRVYIDPIFLSTLPIRELRNGFAEIIKAGAIYDRDLFEYLERHCQELQGTFSVLKVRTSNDRLLLFEEQLSPEDAEINFKGGQNGNNIEAPNNSSSKEMSPVNILSLPWPMYEYVLSASIAVKMQVVSQDERESDLRSILNFGHTVGHGIEHMMLPTLLHGECVAIGMVSELEIARALGYVGTSTIGRLKSLCEAFQLPVRPPLQCSTPPGLHAVLSSMLLDKKNQAGGGSAARIDPGVWTVLLTQIGHVAGPPYTHAVPSSLVQRVLSRAVTLLPQPVHMGEVSGTAPKEVTVPGSKSVSNRVLLLSALVDGSVDIAGLLFSDDTQVMMKCLSALGCAFREHTLDGRTVVHAAGARGRFRLPPVNPSLPGGFETLYIQNAGTASRFLASVLPLLPLHELQEGQFVVLAGNDRMAVRPIGPLVEALRAQGVEIDYLGNKGCPPLAFKKGLSLIRDSRGVHGTLPPGISSYEDYLTKTDASTKTAGASTTTSGSPPIQTKRRVVYLQAELSSQYVSSILMAAPLFPPLLYTPDTAGVSAGSTPGTASTTPDSTPPLRYTSLQSSTDDPTDGSPDYTELLLAEETPTSLPYIKMTIATMRAFGVHVLTLAPNRYLIPRTRYLPPESGKTMAPPGVSVARVTLDTAPATTASPAPSSLYRVEPDASTASYPATLGVLTGRSVVIRGMHKRSLQGDAQYPLLLQRMGAKVIQDDENTYVHPPNYANGEGLVGIDVNMADQTDCFMTLAMVAAVAEGTTRITGIANQRIKECNRIEATVTELRKLGIHAEELPDGISVTGCGMLGPGTKGGQQRSDWGLRGGMVHCYEDHRLAMSFSLLGTLVPGVVLDDAACVEKTFPEWWDFLSSWGYRVCAPSVSPATSAAATSAEVTAPVAAPPSHQKSVVLIGMRGVGKSSFAPIAASVLNERDRGRAGGLGEGAGVWVAADMDCELQKWWRKQNGPGAENATCADIIRTQGWEAFREMESRLLEQTLFPGATGGHGEAPSSGAPPVAAGGTGARRMDAYHVLACGGGVVESPRAVAALQRWKKEGGVVLLCSRDGEDIARDLGLPLYQDLATRGGETVSGSASATTTTIPPAITSERPAYPGGVSLQDTLQRRLPLFHACKTHHFVCIAGETQWDRIRDRFAQFVHATLGSVDAPRHLPIRRSTTTTTTTHITRTLNHTFFAPNVPFDEPTAFVCLALPDLRTLLPQVQSVSGYPHTLVLPVAEDALALGEILYDLSLDVDAIELRVDCWKPPTGQQKETGKTEKPAESKSNTFDSTMTDFAVYQLALARYCLPLAESKAAEPKSADLPVTLVVPARPSKPVVWTVRTATEGGQFRGSDEEYLHLLRTGLECGVEYVDIELSALLRSAFQSDILALLHRYPAKLILSVHWPSPHTLPDETQLYTLFQSIGSVADLLPLVHRIKLVATAKLPDDVYAFRSRIDRVLRSVPAVARIPRIQLCMGAAGVLSRVQNTCFTPVTHPLLPNAAAPGQKSMQELLRLKEELGLFAPRKYYLFGTPIQQSPSPAMHNAAFAALHLPHSYGLWETQDPYVVNQVLRGLPVPSTGGTGASKALPHASTSVVPVGGANITIPLKEDVIPYCDYISPAAAAIGAVNTILTVPMDSLEGELPSTILGVYQKNPNFGAWASANANTNASEANPIAPTSSRMVLMADNTDWLGIYNPLAKRLAERDKESTVTAGMTTGTMGGATKYALVVGSGGTALAAIYALKQLGLQVLIYARNAEKANELVEKFQCNRVLQLSEVDAGRLAVLVNTLPASVQWTAPIDLLYHQPVVMDVNYRPLVTPLVQQAEATNCPIVTGTDMLLAQGVISQALWTGKAIVTMAEENVEGTENVPHLSISPGVPVFAMAQAILRLVEANAS